MFVLAPGTFGKLTPDELHANCVQVITEMGTEIRRVSQGEVKFVAKTSYAGIPGGDITSQADLKSQAKLLELFPDLFPGFGLQAEEDGLTIEPTLVAPEGPVIMTADPLDATRLYEWLMTSKAKTLYGISVMLSIKLGRHVIAVYILDVFAETLYYVAPGTRELIKRTKQGVSVWIQPITQAPPLSEGQILVYGDIAAHPGLIKWLARAQSNKSSIGFSVVKKSIGLCLLDVVLGQPLAEGGSKIRPVALVRKPGGYFTPWDDAPVNGLCQNMGICTFWVTDDGSLEEVRLTSPNQITQRRHGVLYIPHTYVPELQSCGGVRLLSG